MWPGRRAIQPKGTSCISSVQAGGKLGKQYRGRTGSSANSSQALVLGPCSYPTACAATLIPSIYLAPDLRVEAQELPHE